MNNFNYAQFLANELYGVDVRQDLFEELGLMAFRKIGNFRLRTYHITVEPENNMVKLPCNAKFVESVTLPLEDWNRSTNWTNNGDITSSIVEQYIEREKYNTHELYQSGQFAKYKQIDDTLYFTHPYPVVNIIYRGELVDDEGLPRISDSEAEAIAAYVGFIARRKKALQSQNKADFDIAKEIEKEWLIKCDQARVPEYINQNEMDQILEAKLSWNRKVYNKSYKPLR